MARSIVITLLGWKVVIHFIVDGRLQITPLITRNQCDNGKNTFVQWSELP